MRADALRIIQTLFGPISSLFTSWHFPGTQVTPAGWAFFVLGSTFSLKLLKRLVLDDLSGKNG